MSKLASKVFVCGVDAMDPKLTRKYIDMGLMPNAQCQENAGERFCPGRPSYVGLHADGYAATVDHHGHRLYPTGAWDHIILPFRRRFGQDQHESGFPPV